MARGNAEFTQMKPLKVDVRDDIPKNPGGIVDMDLEDAMEVKAFSNTNFAVSMGARNAARMRKFRNKPVPPKMPIQGRQGLQGNPGTKPLVTPPSQPIGGRKPNTRKTKDFLMDKLEGDK